MIIYLHKLAFYSHVIFGTYALIAFWLPLYGKKGTERHKRLGKRFVNAMYFVVGSGFIMSLLTITDPITIHVGNKDLSEQRLAQISQNIRQQALFLLMLVFLVFNSTKHAMLVLKAKADRSLLRQPSHLIGYLLLGLLSIGLIAVGLNLNSVLMLIFAGIGILNVVGSLHYIYKPQLKQREWIIEHLGNILGCGIGVYTAFFAFGGRRFFEEIMTGNLQLIPWMMPAVIGISANIWLAKKYRRQFKVA
jgi:hypothetical protein